MGPEKKKSCLFEKLLIDWITNMGAIESLERVVVSF